MREERELHFANQLKGGVYFSPGEFCVDIKGEPVLYFKLIQRTKCLIESTSIGCITDQQSQSIQDKCIEAQTKRIFPK